MAEGSQGAATTVNLDDPAIKAIVADRVETQTTALRERAEKAETDLAAARTQVDVLEAEKAAATQRAETAETELASVRETAEHAEQAATRRDARRNEIVEVAAHLGDEWFAAEVASGDKKIKRIDKIALMTDEEFASYKGELASAFEGVQVAPAAGGAGAGGGGGAGAGTPPRETAMRASTSEQAGAGGSSAQQFLGGVFAYGTPRRR